MLKATHVTNAMTMTCRSADSTESSRSLPSWDSDCMPVAGAIAAPIWDQVAPAALGQPVLTAVSSTTNEVCSEESSVPVNLRVTLPVKAARE